MMAKTTIEVPEGMTPEKLLELVQSYEDKRVKNSARNKAKRIATTKLVKAHQAEFDGYIKAEMPKAK
jgi:hypothetical protein